MKDVCLALNIPTTRKNQASASKLLFAQYPASRFRVLMTQTVVNVSGTQLHVPKVPYEGYNWVMDTSVVGLFY